MAVHREKSLDYEGPLHEGRGWWVFAAQQMRSIFGFRRTKIIVPLLWIPALIAGLLVIGEFFLVQQSGGAEPPLASGFEGFLQVQFYSLALLYAATSAQTVAHDLRYRTTQLYFSKPVQRWEYSAGKILGLVGIGSFVTVLPLALIGAVRAALYTEFDAAATMGQDVAIALGLSLLLTAICAVLIVGISSTTKRVGFAVLAWLAIILLPELTAIIASAAVDSGGYVRALSPQGAIYVLSSQLISGEYADITAAVPVLSVLIWLGVGLGLHGWRLADLDEGG